MTEVEFKEKIFSGLRDLVRSQRIAVTKAKEKHDSLERLYTAKNLITTYHVTTTSMWADHGEKPANASSRNLKRAITNAGKKHHRLNKRTDWQVHWKVKVVFLANGDEASFELQRDMYKNLLPNEK